MKIERTCGKRAIVAVENRKVVQKTKWRIWMGHNWLLNLKNLWPRFDKYICGCEWVRKRNLYEKSNYSERERDESMRKREDWLLRFEEFWFWGKMKTKKNLRVEVVGVICELWKWMNRVDGREKINVFGLCSFSTIFCRFLTKARWLLNKEKIIKTMSFLNNLKFIIHLNYSLKKSC